MKLELTTPQFIALRSLVADLVTDPDREKFKDAEWVIINSDGHTTVTIEELFVLLVTQ